MTPIQIIAMAAFGFATLMAALLIVVGVALIWLILNPTRFWGHLPLGAEEVEMTTDTEEFEAIIEANYPNNQF